MRRLPLQFGVFGLLAAALLVFLTLGHSRAGGSAEAAGRTRSPNNWIQPSGAGLLVPACSSSQPPPANGTCGADGRASVTISWTYGGQHGACESATVGIENGPTVTGKGCTDQHTFTGLAANTAYQYGVHWFGQRCTLVSDTGCIEEQTTEIDTSDNPGSTTPGPFTTLACAPPAGTISADPNPCQIRPGSDRCTSRISWNTTNAPQAQVWVTPASGGTPQLFHGLSAGSNVDAPWIVPSGYRFQLFSNASRSTLLSEVIVRANAAPQPDLVPRIINIEVQ